MSTDKPSVPSTAPSGASRWTSCEGSARKIVEDWDKIDHTEPDYSKEGRIAHALAAHKLDHEQEPPAFEDINEDMVEHTENYATLVREQPTEDDAVRYVEQKIPVWFRPEKRCYVDSAWWETNKLTINDFKYGVGVGVVAEANKQLAIYAISMVRHLENTEDWSFADDTVLELNIYQPRCPYGSPLKTWTTTLGELLEFVEAEILPSAHRIVEDWENNEVGQLSFQPSESNCQFCPVAPFCEHRAGWLLGEDEVVEGLSLLDGLQKGATDFALEEDLSLLGEEVDVDTLLDCGTLVLPKPTTLTVEQRAALVRKAPAIKKFLDQLERYTQNRLMAGHSEEAPGFKIVESVKHRKWDDEEAANRFLAGKIPADKRWKKKFLTPSQAEQALKGQDLSTRFTNKLQTMIVKPEGNPIMVNEDDPRGEFSINASEEFEVLTDEDLLD